MFMLVRMFSKVKCGHGFPALGETASWAEADSVPKSGNGKVFIFIQFRHLYFN